MREFKAALLTEDDLMKGARKERTEVFIENSGELSVIKRGIEKDAFI